MLAIKASIQGHDRFFHPSKAGQYVLTAVPSEIKALLNPAEMSAIFTANQAMLEVLLPDYIEALEGDRAGSINRLYIRRGVLMPFVPGKFRQELHYLSSFSLALTPAEQFAQTWNSRTKHGGFPCIFSAAIPAVQNRVVAFAPFLHQMTLAQMEVVVAPPLEPTRLLDRGQHGGIRDFEFE